MIKTVECTNHTYMITYDADFTGTYGKCGGLINSKLRAIFSAIKHNLFFFLPKNQAKNPAPATCTPAEQPSLLLQHNNRQKSLNVDTCATHRNCVDNNIMSNIKMSGASLFIGQKVAGTPRISKIVSMSNIVKSVDSCGSAKRKNKDHLMTYADNLFIESLRRNKHQFYLSYS